MTALAEAPVVPAARTDRRRFHRFLAAFTLSQHGDGVTQFVLPVLALSVSGSARDVGLVAAAGRLPWLLAPVAGQLADSPHRMRLLRGSLVLRAVAALTVAATTFVAFGGAGALAVGALVIGLADVVHDTVAHTVVPGLLPISELTWANGRLQSAEFAAGHLLGPVVGGALLGLALWSGPGLAALCWALALVPLAMVRSTTTNPASGPATEPVSGTWRAAFGALQDTSVRLGLAGMVLANLSLSVVLVAAPTVVVPTAGAGTYGVMMAGIGVVGLVAALVADVVMRRGSVLPVAFAGLAVASAPVALALTDAPLAVGAGLAATGMVAWINVAVVSRRQARVPRAVLGRVTSLFRLASWGALPVGSAAAGLLLPAAGTAPVMTGAAVLAVVATVVLATAEREPRRPVPADRPAPVEELVPSPLEEEVR